MEIIEGDACPRVIERGQSPVRLAVHRMEVANADLIFSTLSAESTAHTSTSSVIKAEPCNVPAKPPMTTNSIPASASRFSNTCRLCLVVSSGFSQLPSKCQRSLLSRSSVIVGESQVRIHQTQIEPGPLGLLDSFVVGILFSKSVHDGPARNEHISANHRRRSRSPAHGFIRYVKKIPQRRVVDSREPSFGHQGNG
jgi:hypothetical protein